MRINLFLRHLLAMALMRDKEALGNAKCTFRDMIVFPHQSTRKMINQETGELMTVMGEINVTGEYHFGFIHSYASDLMRYMSNDINGISRDFGSIEGFLDADRVFSPSKLESVKQLYAGSTAIKGGVAPEVYVYLTPEVSDILMAKMQSELDNIVFHMDEKEADDPNKIMDFMIAHASDFPALNYVFSEKMNLVDHLERYDAARSEILSLVQEDNMRTRLNRLMKASQESAEQIVMTSSSIGYSKKSFIDFRMSLNLFMWYLKLYPNVVTNQRLGTKFNISSMYKFISRIMEEYTVADALTAILQRGFGLDLEGNDTISSLLKIILKGVMNSGSFMDAASELNDIFTEDFYLSYSNIGPESTKNAVSQVIAEAGITMKSFLNADVSMDLLPVYTQVYINESVANDLDREEDGGSFIEKLVYKGKAYVIDKKKKRYQVLLNDINKDIALATSSANEFNRVSDKHNLIKEVHDIKENLIDLKDKASNVGDDDLLDIIADRIEHVEALVDTINSRTVREEKKISINESTAGVIYELYNFEHRILESVADDLSRKEEPGVIEKFLFRRKAYKIDKSKMKYEMKYEMLVNDINKDIALAVNASKELTSIKQKNKLLKEIHDIKEDLLKLKYKAHKVGFTELEDVIAERMEYSDKVIDAVNSRVIRKEQQDSRAKGPFHLEGDLADRL